MSENKINQNKVNIYSAIQAAKKKHIAGLQNTKSETAVVKPETLASNISKFTPIKKQTPNGYVFYSYRNQTQNPSSVLTSQESLNTIPAETDNSQITTTAVKSQNLPLKAQLKQIESLEKQKEFEKDHKYFFIGLLLFLNLALFALIAYNQIRFLQEGQNLINNLNSSIGVFQKEIKSSTNSILDELRNLIDKSQMQNNKQSFFVQKTQSFKTSSNWSKNQNKELTEIVNPLPVKQNMQNEKEKSNNPIAAPAANFSVIKLPMKAASEGYSINLTGQAELHSSYETIAKNNNNDFFSDQKKFYKSRKE